MSRLSDLAPSLSSPVGPVTERLPMPGTVTLVLPLRTSLPGAMVSEPLLPTQNLVLQKSSSGRNVAGVINASSRGRVAPKW